MQEPRTGSPRSRGVVWDWSLHQNPENFHLGFYIQHYFPFLFCPSPPLLHLYINTASLSSPGPGMGSGFVHGVLFEADKSLPPYSLESKLTLGWGRGVNPAPPWQKWSHNPGSYSPAECWVTCCSQSTWTVSPFLVCTPPREAFLSLPGENLP